MTTIPVKIFISGYPQNFDELALAQLISPYGEVSTVKIVRNKQSGKAKGYAFIETVDRKSAEAVAIALDGLEMEDKNLTVNIVEEKPAAPVRAYQKAGRQVKPKRPRLNK